MTRTRLYRSRLFTAAVLGVAAALVTYLPPLELNQRLDGIVFNAWARWFADDASTGIALVTLEDEAWLGPLAEVARRDGARLLITTLPQPPSAAVNKFVLGPTQIPLGAQLLRQTDWLQGGHLWFERDSDGHVRSDQAHFDDSPELNSLAWAAYDRLATEPAAASGQIRFRSPASFIQLTPADLLEPAGQLANLVVVAGRPVPTLATPLGPMSQHALVAQALAGYDSGSQLGSSWVLHATTWLLLLGLLAFIARPQANEQHLRWLYPAATAGGLVLISAAAYTALDSWVPIAMPATTLAVASALLLTRPRRRLSVPDLAVDTEGAGQRLLAEGRLEEAWTVYRAVPPTRELFGELYELGHQLDLGGFAELAADAFHRIALVDVKYKDVAARLVRATRWHAENANDEDDEEHKLPAKIGPYELLEPIGSGSTGRVLLARDSRINRIVAVKIIDLLAEFEPSELVQAKDQFRREAETAGRLSHPNIVTIYDIGEADSLAYIAMAYLKGRHLSDFTATNQLLPIDLVLQLGAQAADALDYAHDQNVVHRDIKPANIMYDSLSGSLTITDFGIARLIDVSRTRTGIVLGTPSFMAPEQLEGRNVNGHTDLFALGVTLYELLTGRLPFRGASMTELMFVIANEPHQPVTAVRPDLPAVLDSVIDRALAKEPNARYARGADMADALRAAAQR